MPPCYPARVRLAPGLPLLLLLIIPACGGDSSKYAAAAITAGVAVAAAGANRALTGDCWAECPPGKMCDEESGTCVPLPCHGQCPTGTHCQIIRGSETCVQGHERDVIDSSDEPDAGLTDGAVPDAGDSTHDPCRGLCFRSERCVVKKGVAECESVP